MPRLPLSKSLAALTLRLGFTANAAAQAPTLDKYPDLGCHERALKLVGRRM